MALEDEAPQALPEPTAWPTLAGVEYLDSHDVEEAGADDGTSPEIGWTE